MRFLRLLSACWLVAVPLPFARAAEPPVAVDVAARRSEIRAIFLKATPLGSSSADVLAFIEERLFKKGAPLPALEAHPADGPSAAASSQRGTQRIRLNLGDYPNPSLLTLAPMFPFEESLVAQWAFDPKGRLLELFLDRDLKK